MSVWNAPTAMNDRRQYLQSRWCRPRHCAAVAVMIATVFLAVFLGALAFAASPISPAWAAEPEVGVGAETKLPIPRFASLKSENVYVRTGPSMDYPIKWIYKRAGLPVEIIQEYDAWRRIRDPDGETGWVHKILLSGHRSAVIRNAAAGQAPVTAFADHDLVSAVAKLETKYIVTIHECDARACLAQFAPYEGWIEKKYLWGVYGSEIFQ